MVISNIVDQLKYEDILLEPDFQRHPDLWNAKQQSRLIQNITVLPLSHLVLSFLGQTSASPLATCYY